MIQLFLGLSCLNGFLLILGNTHTLIPCMAENGHMSSDCNDCRDMINGYFNGNSDLIISFSFEAAYLQSKNKNAFNYFTD